MTVVRCAVEITAGFRVGVSLHQGALSPLLFDMVMDRQIDEVRQEFLWTMIFADDIAICSERGEQEEGDLGKCRYALESQL